MRGSARGTAQWHSGRILGQGQGRKQGKVYSVNVNCRNELNLSGKKHPQFQLREFISLPKLPTIPNILKPLSSSRHYKDRILVKYSQQEFFDLVANVDDYHKFLPWCTYSKMSEPLPAGSEKEQEFFTIDSTSKNAVTVRHGELGVGFNSFQERYVSKVTCQEPSAVRAVSYDSKLFKELATIWKFTPNIPRTTTLDAAMDQELQEAQLLTKHKEDHPKSSKEDSSSSISTPSRPPPPPPPPEPKRPKHHFTAAAVFGEAVIAKLRIPDPLPMDTETQTPTSTSETTAISQPKTHVQWASSPSNLAIMKPSDYPSCWIDFEIQFEFASPVHASMSSLFFDQVSKEMLQAFIKQAEVLYGQR
ncbi:Coenzyme Q-binding protein coq10a, mitochondrial [Haplosporangium sp. Z 27]|nr:Coenzyme Q-binding protein coq10a, mitochondrial [Haplosporangium sp. Z 27]